MTASEVVPFETVLRMEHETIARRRGRPIEVVGFDSWRANGTVYDTIGLCLSGGGIRSAAFCLGAVQALGEAGQFDKMDYLSTVSGGGYIGCSLSAHLMRNGGVFPFTCGGDKNDAADVSRIRDYSNYLIPSGGRDLILNLAVVMRGWVTNILNILPVLLLLAAITLMTKPTTGSLEHTGVAILPFRNSFFDHRFGVTLSLALIEAVLFGIWAMWHSTLPNRNTEITGLPVRIAAGGLVLLGIAAFCELQPIMLYALAGADGSWSTFLRGAMVFIAGLVPVIVSLGGVLGNVIKIAEAESGTVASIKKASSKVLAYAAALALPILLWSAYLTLSLWGLASTSHAPGFTAWSYAPGWLATFSTALPTLRWVPPVAFVYLLAAAAMFVTWPFLRSPNANSLHRLYRDRLRDAFLRWDSPSGADGNFLLSELSPSAPYSIINTALNIQNSSEVNKRGRNADFFIFSRLYSGSQATGYLATDRLQVLDKKLDLATAMAVSGAAISSNMGSESIRVMSPTLALLNLRLGYWIPNPRSSDRSLKPRRLYLLAEMFGLLDEKSRYVYLTDGGHVENLGLYELLRRRCQLIVVIDAEADPGMNFGALVRLERYARIDLGIRIELPWAAIKKRSLEIRSGGTAASSGPHCAVGCIEYATGVLGYLLYVKSSLTGDENDYVADYARRYSRFPHETTGDQFFSEEQFEAYRALGFHALYGCLSGRDVVETRLGTPETLKGPPIKDAHLGEVARLLT